MSAGERARRALIELNRIPGLGAATIRRLLDAFESPEAVFGADEASLKEILGRYATQEVLQAIRGGPREDLLEEELRLAEKESVRIVTVLDEGYPELLKTIPDPPPVLYVKGTLLEEDAAAVAVVGTRRASPYGLSVARRLGADLARCGVTVLSGLAEGIDGAAHEGALQAKGRTIAVLGHGLKFLFPAIHRKLADRIVESGALVSEFPLGMPPEKPNFPRRNRVIAGLSQGVVVVEAPLKSGSLITAREALEQGREVFAVPGPISSPKSQGTHRLIKDGAKLVENVQDILTELAPHLKARLEEWREPAARLSDEESAVYAAIPVGEAVTVELLAHSTEFAAPRLLSVLTGLELKGVIKQIPGQGFSRP